MNRRSEGDENRRRMPLPKFAMLAADFLSNRKVRRAGAFGAQVYIFALLRNAQERTGSIPASELDPWYIADQWQIAEDDARAGVERAIAAGLLEIRGDVAFIAGWDETWSRKALTESEARQLRRKRGHGDSEPEERKKKNKNKSSPDTPGHGPDVVRTRPDVVRTEEPKESAQLTDAIAHFTGRFERAYSAKPTWGAKPAAQLKRLVTAHGVDEVKRRTDVLFNSPPSWLKGPYDVGTLVQHFDKLVKGSTEGRTLVLKGRDDDDMPPGSSYWGSEPIHKIPTAR